MALVPIRRSLVIPSVAEYGAVVAVRRFPIPPMSLAAVSKSRNAALISEVAPPKPDMELHHSVLIREAVRPAQVSHYVRSAHLQYPLLRPPSSLFALNTSLLYF